MIYWKDGKLQNVGKDIFKLTPVNASDGAGGTYETNLIEAGMYCFAENQNISERQMDSRQIPGRKHGRKRTDNKRNDLSRLLQYRNRNDHGDA